MVLGAFEKYVFGPRREAQKLAEEERRKAEEAQRRLDEYQTAVVEAWNERRLKAQARGEAFDEPPPSRRGETHGTGRL